MKAREIILLVLIVAGGIILTQEKTGKIWPDGWAGDFLFFDGRAFTFQESQVVEAPLPATLSVVNAHGEVSVEAAETDRITLTLEKIVRRRDEAEARAVAEKIKATVGKDGLAVVIGTNRDEFTNPRFDTNFRITVPAGLAVEVENSYGAVKIRGVSSAAIVNRHGEVDASRIGGALKVDNTYEDVTVDGVRGACQIQSSHSEVLARRIDGGLTLDHAYGMATLQDIAVQVSVEGPHSGIVAQDIAGPVEIRNSYEQITLRRVGPVKVTGHHSDIEADEVNGGLEIATEYALVSAHSVRGGLRVTGKSVGVSGDGLTDGEIYLSTSYEPVELSGFSGKATILVSHGDVTLAPLPLTGPVEVRGEYAGIRLRWPGGGPYPFTARAKSGEVVWQLAETVQVEDKEGVREVRAFSGLTDKPEILLVTSYDDIEVDNN
jgi:DUF4097 and DUF4098 domain-containing protein YvlB